MAETYTVRAWYTGDEQYSIEADSPETAIETAHERFIAIGRGSLDGISVEGTEEGHITHPLPDGEIHVTAGSYSMSERQNEPTIIKNCPKCGSGYTVMGRNHFRCTDCGSREEDWVG